MLLSFSNDSFTDEDVIFLSGIVGEGKFESIPDHTSGVPAWLSLLKSSAFISFFKESCTILSSFWVGFSVTLSKVFYTDFLINRGDSGL